MDDKDVQSCYEKKIMSHIDFRLISECFGIRRHHQLN